MGRIGTAMASATAPYSLAEGRRFCIPTPPQPSPGCAAPVVDMWAVAGGRARARRPDPGGAVLVDVGPATDLDHCFHVGDDELGVLVGHDVGACDHRRAVGHLHGPVRVAGQVLDRLELASVLLEMLEDLALRTESPFHKVLQRPMDNFLIFQLSIY